MMMGLCMCVNVHLVTFLFFRYNDIHVGNKCKKFNVLTSYNHCFFIRQGGLHCIDRLCANIACKT